MVTNNTFNPKGAGPKATVWRHGAGNSFKPLNVPDVSKDLIYSIGLVVDHLVSMREEYDRALVLKTIECVLMDYENATNTKDICINVAENHPHYIKHKYNGYINTRNV
jgi:hypothetical protein